MRFVLLFLIVLPSLGKGQTTITGVLLDSTKAEPLPYSAVRLIGTSTGTSTNALGEFSIMLEQQAKHDSLEFSCLGYLPRTIAVHEVINTPKILLPAKENVLKVFTVRPISAAEQIRRCVKMIPANYPSGIFNSRSYYHQVIKENDSFLNYSEGVFQNHHTGKDNESQNQLVLFREPFSTQQLNVMSRRAEKRREKFIKKNPEKADSIPANVTEILSTSMAHPGIMFQYDVRDSEMLYLDTTIQNRFKFEYGKETSMDGRDLMTIEFKSKGSIENAVRWGSIYIDVETDAIVMIKEGGRIRIPAYVKPILVLVGIGVKNPRYDAQLRYRYFGGKWYPELIRWDVALHLVDKPMFKKNTHADMHFAQLMHVQHIDTTLTNEIAAEKRFKSGKPMENQVHPIGGLNWSGVDVIR